MKYLYAPGCALVSYKPHLAEKLKEYVVKKYGEMDTLLTCCFDVPEKAAGSCIITPCATCVEQYAKVADCTTVLFLKDLVESEDFPFPDYGGIRMSIQDTCAARKQPETLTVLRRLLERMNIELVEPEHTGSRARCCGQVFYGKLEISKVEAMMKKRADEMPCEDVVVYCASCIMSMTVGGKKPRYILDLLFGEPTDMTGTGVESWNGRLRNFRKAQLAKS